MKMSDKSIAKAMFASLYANYEGKISTSDEIMTLVRTHERHMVYDIKT